MRFCHMVVKHIYIPWNFEIKPKRTFWEAYNRRGLYLEGNLRFKIVIIIWWLICAKHYQIYIKHKQIHKTLTNGCTKHYKIIKTLANIQNTYKHSYFHVFFFYSYNGLVWYSRMKYDVNGCKHIERKRYRKDVKPSQALAHCY